MSNPNEAVRSSALGDRMARGTVGFSDLSVTEVLRGHLNLRADPEHVPLIDELESQLKIGLPRSPGTYEDVGPVRASWLGPGEWLINVPYGQQGVLETRLRHQTVGPFAIADLSSGQTILRLSGPKCADILRKSCNYDTHPNVFGIGRCAQTYFAKAPILLARNDHDTVDLTVRRSFGDYLWLWLRDAATMD